MPLPAARSILDFASHPFSCLLHDTMSITDLSQPHLSSLRRWVACFLKVLRVLCPACTGL
ncbi:hypothetical protein Amal_00533 [Acetobacter malorum]|uniref:Uncharacterized protein n=1 Tax=Acetobacter malorum TaxID=178901 RepID=A0A177GFR2_9PROT|nr:hypothetical protein Amal_00533 [Acetobacter malorum]